MVSVMTSASSVMHGILDAGGMGLGSGSDGTVKFWFVPDGDWIGEMGFPAMCAGSTSSGWCMLALGRGWGGLDVGPRSGMMVGGSH
jgi:hypothetical protein